MRLSDIAPLPQAASAMQHFRNPKLDSALSKLSHEVKQKPEAASDLARSLGLKVKNDKIWVLVLAKPDHWDEAAEILRKAGAEGLKTSLSRKRRLRCWLPVTALEAVAAENAISRIRRPRRPFVPPQPPDRVFQPTQGTVTSEALPIMNVPAWHFADLKGQGIKVGVIDFGFEGYNALKGTELPSVVTVNNFVEGEGQAEVDGGVKHGTACAEIIHDIAPMAELYFAKVDEPDDIEEAVTWFLDQGVKVVSASIGWYNLDAGDGETPDVILAEQVTRARHNGMLFVASAGNDRRLHWGGVFDPLQGEWGGTDITYNIWGDGVGVINCFGQDGTFPDSCDLIESGVSIETYLRWKDNWDGPTTDYVLWLARYDPDEEDWMCVAQANNPQTGWYDQEPTEEVLNYKSTGDPTYYGVFIGWFGHGEKDLVNLDLFTPFYWDRLRHFKTPRSLSGGLCEASDAVTVTAVDVNDPYAQESYSSEGPRDGPGGTAQAATAKKPNLAGYANVSTVSYGVTGFPGTSAATPHVAGATALVMGDYPNFSLTRVQRYLQDRAKDLGDPGWDTIYGYGRVHMGDPYDRAAQAIEAILLLLMTGE